MSALPLSFNDLGDGPPVLILHGLFGRKRNWQAIQKRLADSAHVYTADMRNHGDSPWAESMSYIDMADDLAHMIRGMNNGPVTVVGHSMGGKSAMALALRDPDVVSGLMVIDIAPVGYDHEYQPYINAMRHVPLAKLERRSEADKYLEEIITDRSIRAFLLQNLGQEDDDGLKWQVNLDAIENDLPEILDFPDDLGDPYEGPALFLRGGTSDFVLDSHMPKIESLFPMATLDTVSGAGHWVHAEKPEDVIQQIRDFTQRTA